MFLAALVILATIILSIVSIGIWERQDEALLHTTAESTTSAFLSTVSDQIGAVTQAVGTPASAMISLAKALLPSSWAAAPLGPNTRIPAARR